MRIENLVFTIGHSTHPERTFLGLLREHGITAVCDVRSKPYSRVNPQFNRDNLETLLEELGITYRFLGKELGARSNDPNCYEGGKVQYGRLAQTDLFKNGLRRVCRGIRDGFRIALMCAEKEPLECHRTILVARHLVALGVQIAHIHADGRIESQDEALHRLIRALHMPEQDMFHSSEELADEAYRRQEERIAYEVDDATGAALKRAGL